MAKVILDISHHETVKDWAKLKENVDFLLFKATEGTAFLDPACYKTIQMCEKYKIPYWLYCFLRKGNELAQAKYMVDKTKGEVGSYFVGYCIDCEKDNPAVSCREALDYIKKYSKKTMIYTAHQNYSIYKSLLAKRGDNCAWWEPRYNDNKPHSGVDLWQYSENYKCDYISGEVDINRLYGSKQLSWFKTPTVPQPVAVPKNADKVISVATGEIGYIEKKSKKDLDSKTANAGHANYTKYGKWIGANGDYWCASFLSWIFYKAYGNLNGKTLLCGQFSAACETIRQNFSKKKKYNTKMEDAKPGDVVFFSGTRHAGANHIGLIVSVVGSKITTIEGNTSTASGVVDNGGGVVKKSYTVPNSKIMGYGRPDYSVLSTTTASKTTNNGSSASKGTSYYPKCRKTIFSLVDALSSVGVKDTSKTYRKKIATANGIKNYSGTALQNLKLLNLLKSGKLIKP